MSRLDDINVRLTELQAELVSFADRDLSEEETARFTECETEYQTLETEKAPLQARHESIERVRTASHNPANRTSGSEPDSLKGERSRNIYDIGNLRSNPFAMADESVQRELVTRAYDAIEDAPKRVSDEAREAATRTLENCQGQTQAAVHILTTGNPAYRSAFRQILKHTPSHVQFLEGEERDAMRAAMSLTSANGGYLLPFELDSTIILTNVGTANQIREISRQVQTTQNVYHLVSSAGVNMEWTTEGGEATDASPTFSQPTITCFKGDVYVQASFEFLEDSNIESQIGMLIADAKARGEATAFTTGNGTDRPKGIVTILQATTASRVSSNTNGAFGSVDVFALDNALGPRWRNNGKWLANKGVYNLVRQMATGSGQQSGSFWVDFGGGIPSQLIGYPTYRASDMTASLSAATASNDDVLVLGDFNQYVVADRIGVSLVYEPLVKGTNQRPNGEVGWYATWRVGADTTNADAFRMLRV